MVLGRQQWGQRSPDATREVARPGSWDRFLAEDSMDHGSAMSQFFPINIGCFSSPDTWDKYRVNE